MERSRLTVVLYNKIYKTEELLTLEITCQSGHEERFC